MHPVNVSYRDLLLTVTRATVSHVQIHQPMNGQEPAGGVDPKSEKCSFSVQPTKALGVFVGIRNYRFESWLLLLGCVWWMDARAVTTVQW